MFLFSWSLKIILEMVPILQEARLTPGPVWTGGKSRHHRDLIPERPARSQSLYRLSYRAHGILICYISQDMKMISRNLKALPIIN